MPPPRGPSLTRTCTIVLEAVLRGLGQRLAQRVRGRADRRRHHDHQHRAHRLHPGHRRPGRQPRDALLLVLRLAARRARRPRPRDAAALAHAVRDRHLAFLRRLCRPDAHAAPGARAAAPAHAAGRRQRQHDLRDRALRLPLRAPAPRGPAARRRVLLGRLPARRLPLAAPQHPTHAPVARREPPAGQRGARHAAAHGAGPHVPAQGDAARGPTHRRPPRARRRRGRHARDRPTGATAGGQRRWRRARPRLEPAGRGAAAAERAVRVAGAHGARTRGERSAGRGGGAGPRAGHVAADAGAGGRQRRRWGAVVRGVGRRRRRRRRRRGAAGRHEPAQDHAVPHPAEPAAEDAG